MTRTRQALFALVVVAQVLVAALRPAPARRRPPGAAAAADRDPPGTTRMLIVPFEVADRDPRAVWLGEAAAVLLGDALRAMQLPALTRAERVRAFEEANLPTDGRLSLASLVRVGHLVLASDLIVGTVRLSGEELVIDARRIRLDTGRLVEQTTDRAPLPELFALHERVARRLMGRQPTAGGTPAPTAAPAGGLPLGAFENYIKGADRRAAGGADPVPAGGAAPRAAGCPDPPRAGRGLRRSGRSRAGAGRSAGGAADGAARPPGALPGGPIAGRARRASTRPSRRSAAWPTSGPPPRSTTTSA